MKQPFESAKEAASATGDAIAKTGRIATRNNLRLEWFCLSVLQELFACLPSHFGEMPPRYEKPSGDNRVQWKEGLQLLLSQPDRCRIGSIIKVLNFISHRMGNQHIVRQFKNGFKKPDFAKTIKGEALRTKVMV
jgi:hypothetical protein